MAPKARAPKTPEEALSRALAKTLRHAAKSQGIPQDNEGWCEISDLLKHQPYINLKATPDTIENVVVADKKGRYEFNEDKSKIRAVQGHSVNVDVGLTALEESQLPELIVHGTYLDIWPTIRNEGLNRMKRQHIHLAQNLPSSIKSDTRQISGMRSSSQVYIFIDGPKAMRAGIQFFMASNGAILSSGIDGVIKPDFFLKVTNNKLELLD
ncbi:tRNA 2'-phosphotransferase [Starmerella bacillaris]|uniref:2'-phosphotransferase n=1 Tax=Starmerella bacillaris TaxID=1247836 RepID=A0AAV5RGI9_STABA|nr:tRNA 2'-phosphotransferase [Starmerella bacillaris]